MRNMLKILLFMSVTSIVIALKNSMGAIRGHAGRLRFTGFHRPGEDLTVARTLFRVLLIQDFP